MKSQVLGPGAVLNGRPKGLAAGAGQAAVAEGVEGSAGALLRMISARASAVRPATARGDGMMRSTAPLYGQGRAGSRLIDKQGVPGTCPAHPASYLGRRILLEHDGDNRIAGAGVLAQGDDGRAVGLLEPEDRRVGRLDSRRGIGRPAVLGHISLVE